MAEKKQCAGEVRGTGQFGWLHRYPCDKNATLEHEGKWYCKTHHPPSVQVRADKRYAEYRARIQADQERARQAAANVAERDRKARAYDAVVHVMVLARRVPVQTNAEVLASEIDTALATK